jgi:hypothetical protein
MSIRIFGQARRSFIFPSDLDSAFTYFSDIDRIFSYLPHITLSNHFTNSSYRLIYQSTELGVYHVSIYADLKIELDQHSKVLRIKKAPTIEPVPAEAGWNQISGQGSYESQSLFSAQGNHTRIDYSLTLQSALPVPGAARVMPEYIRNAVANSITHRRIREIADAFVVRSIRAYT